MSAVFRSLRTIFPPKPPTVIPVAAATLTSTTTTTSKPNKRTKTRKPPTPPPDPFKRHVSRFKKLCENQEFRAQLPPYEALVRRLAAAEKYSYIEEIIEHQKKYDDAMKKEAFIVRLISLYGKAKMFEHAHKLFTEMPELNCNRTVLSFNALLMACVNSKKYEKLRVLFRELPGKLDIEPDTVSYNIVAKSFCDLGSVDSAVEVIGAMEKDGLEPTLVTYNTIMHSLYQDKRIADAERMWEQMVGKNIVPDVRSYNAKLRGLCADKLVSEAVDLIQEMEMKGVKPDVYTYNALIHGFLEDRNLVEVKKWYGEILKKDLLPDRVTIFMVVPFACDAGDFDFAYELSKKVISIKVAVYKEVLQRVVDGLVKELDMDKAEELVELVNTSKHLRFKLQLPTGKDAELLEQEN